MSRERQVRWAAVALLAALLVACGDAGSDPTGNGEVVFGEGEIPDSMPRDFPIPEGAVIGTSLVDGVNVRTEVQLRVASDTPVVAQFYNLSLVSNGFVVEDSSDDGNRFRIEFRRDGITGRVTLTSLGGGITDVVVEVNDA